MDLETATTRLYEDASLTEDLIDKEASALLKWAEGCLPKMIKQHPDDATFDEAFKALRSVVKGVNRLVGQGETMDDTERGERMQKIAESLSVLGMRMPTEMVGQLIVQISGVNNKLDALQALLNTMTMLNPPAGMAAVSSSPATPDRLAQMTGSMAGSPEAALREAAPDSDKPNFISRLAADFASKDMTDGEEKPQE